SPTLPQAINKKIASLDKDFQKYNVNTLKGAFNEDYIRLLNQRITSALQQAIESSHGKMEYANAMAIVRNLLMKDLLQQHHALLQKTLYALDPSKVERTEVFIPMRDGVQLSAQLFRDVNTKEKLPAIISQSPYPSGTE